MGDAVLGEGQQTPANWIPPAHGTDCVSFNLRLSSTKSGKVAHVINFIWMNVSIKNESPQF